jgi:hypothetical protein
MSFFLLPGASFRPRSSYLCLFNSWEYRREALDLTSVKAVDSKDFVWSYCALSTWIILCDIVDAQAH